MRRNSTDSPHSRTVKSPGWPGRLYQVYCSFSLALSILILVGCRAKEPSRVEKKVAGEVKETIGDRDWKNPIPDDEHSVERGAEYFRRYCRLCHGLDGQTPGICCADKTSPVVPGLTFKHVPEYTDGQLKSIIENGIPHTDMPGWKDIIEEQEIWYIVRYLRHLPAKGSLGSPAEFKPAEKEDNKQSTKRTEQRLDEKHDKIH